MTRAHLHAASPPSTGEMTGLLRAWLDTLAPDLQAKARWPFDEPERHNWHYVPRRRQGVPLRAMSDAARLRVRDLLAFTLSADGLGRVDGIMRLEETLGLIESRPAFRDPLNYSVTVFGEPGGAAPWGWRIEGHHVSLNVTARGTELLAVVPLFLGSNPATVPAGYPQAGTRALGPLSDQGFTLVRALDDGARAEATISSTSMGDIVATPGRERSLGEREGLPLGKMAAAEQNLALDLVASWARSLRTEFAEAELARIRDAGIEDLRFGWGGPIDGKRAHYYRLHGPVTLIEFDNTQNDVNHIHTVWHDLERNFGQDLLRAHYESGAHPHNHG